MPERPKTWDFAPEPGDQHRRIAARHRQAALSASLRDDDAYARNHEALRRAAEILAEACDDFLSRKRRHAAARGDDPEEITLVSREFWLECRRFDVPARVCKPRTALHMMY